YDPEKYLMADFDYFLPLNTNSSKIYTLLYKIITNQKIPEDEKSLIFEKEEFYDYVAKGNLFEKRVSKTADTNKELKFLLPRLKGKILDAGCGNGRLSIPIAKLGYEIIGIDISDELIKQANKNKGEKKYPIFIKGNLLQMPFNNGEFNTVIMMWHVICDLRKYQLELLREISRVTAKEGTLIFDIPDSSKHIKINESGVYEFKIDAFNKYVGLVPDLKEILVFLKATGFTKIIYNRVNWGSPKFVITAKKESLF
ncbi:MAG: methyltransferase domain-containing protein, partial [Candidatus Woesearchaeota archaeon]